MAERPELDGVTGHVVVCNVNEKVRTIIDELRDSPVGKSIEVVIIVQDQNLWKANPAWHPDPNHDRVFEVKGSPADSDVLKQARISHAKAAMILSDPAQGLLADARSTLVAVAIEKENPQVHTVMELQLSVNRAHLRTTIINEVICLGEVAEKLLAQSTITPGINQLFMHLLTTSSDTAQFYLRNLPKPLVGMNYRQLAHRAIKNDAPYILCGFLRHGVDSDGKEKNTIVINPCTKTTPGKDCPLEATDSLVLLSSIEPDLEFLSS
jgi:Trk K+ transport system NAD-binding subunit